MHFTSVVYGEINKVVFTLKNQKNWNNIAKTNDVKLLRDFYVLKLRLKQDPDKRLEESLLFVTPFLNIITSDKTDGESTNTAIISVLKFVNYGFISSEQLDYSEAKEEICKSICNIRFVGLNANSDEKVLMNAMLLLKVVILASGRSISNETMCNSIQTHFKICFETKLSELLRTVACQGLIDITRYLFSDLSNLKDESLYLLSGEELANLKTNLTRKFSPHKKKKSKRIAVNQSFDDFHVVGKSEAPTVDGIQKSSSETNLLKDSQRLTPDVRNLPNDTQASSDFNNGQCEECITKSDCTPMNQDLRESCPLLIGNKNEDSEKLTTVILDAEETVESTILSPQSSASFDSVNSCYDISVLVHFLYCIAVLTDPYNKDNTIEIMKVPVDLFYVVMECCIDFIEKFTCLKEIIQSKILFNLFQLIKWGMSGILPYALNTCFLALVPLRMTLPFHFEYFMNMLCTIASDEQCPQDKRELTLDYLCQVITMPGIIVEMFKYYDCQPPMTNLLLNTVSNLRKIVCQSTHSSILRESSLDALLTIVYFMHDDVINLNYSGDNSNNAQILVNKNKKHVLAMCWEKFNSSPSEGIRLFIQNGFIPKENYEKKFALMLFKNQAVNKKNLGEFFGLRKNTAVVREFVKLFNWKKISVLDALRNMLENFRLPGESPTISNILDQFAAHYLNFNPEGFANHDALFTLSYAIIMLNVDQHNENAKSQKNPMTKHEFVRNVKGINGGESFPQAMLEEIFNSISKHEIVLPSERTGFIKDKYDWSVLLYQNKNYRREKELHDDFLIFHIFQLLYEHIEKPLLLSMSQSSDKSRLEILSDTFGKLITIAAKAGLTDIVDALTVNLLSLTSLLTQKLIAEDLVFNFSNKMTCIYSCRTAFDALFLHGDFLRKSWKKIVHCFVVLFRAKLLPDDLVRCFDYVKANNEYILMLPYCQGQNGNESGLFSSFYQLLIPGNDGLKQSRFDAAFVSTKKMIESLNLSRTYVYGGSLNQESLKCYLKALIAHYEKLDHNVEFRTKMFIFILITNVVYANSHRISAFCQTVRDFYYTCLVVNSSVINDLYERIVVAVFHCLQLSIHYESSNQVSVEFFSSIIRVLIAAPVSDIIKISKSIAFAIHDIVISCKDHSFTVKEWVSFMTLLEIVSAGNVVPTKAAIYSAPIVIPVTGHSSSNNFEWTEHDIFKENSNDPLKILDILLSTYDYIRNDEAKGELGESLSDSNFLSFKDDIKPHIPALLFVTTSFFKRYTSLKPQRINVWNFLPLVHSIWIFTISACNMFINLSSYPNDCLQSFLSKPKDGETLGTILEQRTLDLVWINELLIRRCSNFYEEFNIGSYLAWNSCYYPLLKALAYLCHDTRKSIRTAALDAFQRSLLQADVKNAEGHLWENCFNKILFPMISKLAERNTIALPVEELEELRFREIHLVGKVFLQRLVVLAELVSFHPLWFTFLELLLRMKTITTSEHLAEAIPEILKNIVLVMITMKFFQPDQEDVNNFYKLTEEKISCLLPSLKSDFDSILGIHTEKSGDSKNESCLNEGMPIDQSITIAEQLSSASETPETI